jgi:enoyl-CoA hydratase
MTVNTSVEGGVAVLTVDRPEVRNAISPATMDELSSALDAVAGEADVLVIRGGGDRAFVSGGDLKELAKIRTFDGAVEMALRMRRLCDRIATFPAPVVAVVNGHALGGGAEVAVAADIRVAADDVTIGFNQSRLAIMPAWGGAERLASLVGRSQALLLATTGERIDAAEALRIGLFDRVYPRASFEASWRSLASAIASSPSRSIKSVVAAAAPHQHPELEESAASAFAALWVADAHWAAADALARKLLVATGWPLGGYWVATGWLLVAEGEDRGLDTVLEAELGEDAADVGLDRLLADRQVPGDLPVAVPLGDQPEHVALAG